MKKLLLFLFLGLNAQLFAQMPIVLDLKTQGEIRDQWLEDRVKTVLPEIMDRTGIDMWVLISKEYNEDAVLKTMLPSSWLAARRTTMLVIYKNGDEMETLACARYDVGEVFKKAWDKEQQPNQWQQLADLITERDPKKIGVNKSEDFGLVDGLSATHYEKMMEVLPQKYQDRVVSSEKLAIGWLETRTDAEMVVYQQIMRVAHEIIAEGFSEKVIQPGITTTDDVVWYFRERIRELGMVTWFHPTVDVQRADPGSGDSNRSFSRRPDAAIIQPGDWLHCDFGITYLGLNTDTQENAYILKAGETDAPDYLKEALKRGLETMDFLTNEFKVGRTGNEILASTIQKSKAAGLKPSIYTHPIGYHGHAAGPTIGLWDQQGGVKGKGDYPMYANTAYSIELNTRVFLPAWNKEIRVMMEEDAFFDGKEVRYIDGRQTSLMLVPRSRGHLGK